ncbi:MAG: response regulator transcription factor [Verrucomicrobium sp.]|nr:response regulator transcription factor [Verrucomicrobium sp.]
MSDKALILIADDEEDVRELVGMNLRRAGFETVEAADGLQALAQVRRRKPDAIVLDVMMPGRDGFGVCQELREDESTQHIPVIMLTAKGQTQDRIAGLEKGADDYLAKPFSPKELVLRVQALIRRATQVTSGSELKEGPFEFDLSGVKLNLGGQPMDLTLLEFKLLHLLASRKGEVVERDYILKEVWGYTEQVRTRTLDTHVKRLREKLGDYAEWLQTSRGFGYIFKEPSVVAVAV